MVFVSPVVPAEVGDLAHQKSVGSRRADETRFGRADGNLRALGEDVRKGELTLSPHFPSFFRQRPRRFAPDYRPGIFIVGGRAALLRRRAKYKIYGKHNSRRRPVGR